MREITFPELAGKSVKDDDGWGLSEYLTDFVFSRTDLYSEEEFCKMVATLSPILLAMRGKGQVGIKLKITDSQYNWLTTKGLPDSRLQLMPETQYAIAKCRLAIIGAAEVKESLPDLGK